MLEIQTKMVNGGYYKGTRSGSMGRHTKHGGYIIDYAKVRTYVVPKDLKDFKVCTVWEVFEADQWQYYLPCTRTY